MRSIWRYYYASFGRRYKTMVVRRSFLLLLVLVAITCVFVINITFPGLSFTIPVPRRYLESSEICSTPRTNIYFLKTHKCGSSTVQNILMRYGLRNSCTFVLPASQNYVGNPRPFIPELIGSKLRTPNGKYNIFTHHTRHNASAVREVMYDNAAWVTIMRDPIDLFESLYSYYALEDYYKESFRAFIRNPVVEIHSIPRYASKIGPNQMAWDLGMNTWQFRFNSGIKSLIQKIDRDFDLVMIAEFMEASLILLKETMCWSIDDIVFFSLNARPDNLRINLTDYERRKIADINTADVVLYNYYLNKFRIKVKEFGEERMRQEVEDLLERNLELFEQCVKAIIHPNNPSGPYNSLRYKLRESLGKLQHLCRAITISELDFTELLRRKQAAKIRTMERLEELMSTQTASTTEKLPT